MKVTSKQNRITTVYDDGTLYEYVKKTIIVEIEDSMHLDDAHDAIVSALCDAKNNRLSANCTNLS